MQGWLNFNGSFIEEGAAVVTADNRGLRYGDGLFETMKVLDGQIRLKEFHFKRLFSGMMTLRISLPSSVTPAFLEGQVLRTLEKNRINGAARIRLMIFRGDGGLYETEGKGGGYLIQVSPLEESSRVINENGFLTGLYNDAFKPCGVLSNIKSNNYLLYAMAAIQARENKWNDCLVLNTYGRICESAIANVFWVKNGKIYTPPLSEGCVAGVMRAHLIERLGNITEEVCNVKDIEEADELFLTNAISGIRWVASFGNIVYGNNIARTLFPVTIQ